MYVIVKYTTKVSTHDGHDCGPFHRVGRRRVVRTSDDGAMVMRSALFRLVVDAHFSVLQVPCARYPLGRSRRLRRRVM